MIKILIGLVCGGIGAAINIGFLFFASGIETKVYISTAITWLVIGILISVCNLKLNPILKGVIISFLVYASSLVYSISYSFSGAIWTVVNTIVIGGFIGYCIEKMFKTMEKISNKD